MANPTCFTSLQLCYARVSRLTAAGAPLTGALNGYETDSQVSLDIAVELTTGDEFETKNGCGDICATYKAPDKIKRANLTLSLCQLDARLISMLTGSDTFESGGNVIGMQLPAVAGTTPNNGVCLEVWTKAWDGTQQAVPAFTSPNGAYFHWVFPKVKWTLGQMTLENGLLVVPLTGIAEENTEITANGPFDDWPTPIANAGGITRVFGFWLDDDIPSGACEYVNVTSAAS